MQDHLEGCLNHELLGCAFSDSVGLGLGLRVCIFNKFRGDAVAGEEVLRNTELGEFT